jgi:hypothetical protein
MINVWEHDNATAREHISVDSAAVAIDPAACRRKSELDMQFTNAIKVHSSSTRAIRISIVHTDTAKS